MGTRAWPFVPSVGRQWTAFVGPLLTGLAGHISELPWLWSVSYPALLSSHSPFTKPLHQEAGLALFRSLSLKPLKTHSSLSANISWRLTLLQALFQVLWRHWSIKGKILFACATFISVNSTKKQTNSATIALRHFQKLTWARQNKNIEDPNYAINSLRLCIKLHTKLEMHSFIVSSIHECLQRSLLYHGSHNYQATKENNISHMQYSFISQQ